MAWGTFLKRPSETITLKYFSNTELTLNYIVHMWDSHRGWITGTHTAVSLTQILNESKAFNPNTRLQMLFAWECLQVNSCCGSAETPFIHAYCTNACMKRAYLTMRDGWTHRQLVAWHWNYSVSCGSMWRWYICIFNAAVCTRYFLKMKSKKTIVSSRLSRVNRAQSSHHELCVCMY